MVTFENSTPSDPDSNHAWGRGALQYLKEKLSTINMELIYHIYKAGCKWLADWLTYVAKCLGPSDYPSNLKFGQELDSGMHKPRKIWKHEIST